MFADKIWGDYKFHLVILLCCVLAELVGPIRIPLGGVTITLLPLLYSMIFVLVVYLIKPIKFVKEKQAATGSAMLTLSVAFLMAKLGITSGGSIEQVISAGPVLILQNLGNIGTLLVALPIALLLGMGREAVGMTHAMSREPNVALISDMFGADSAEEATAMAVGAGSASMMTAGLAGIMEAAPSANPDTLTAFASISNVISSSISVYLGLFITVPLGNVIYKAMKKGK